MMMKYKDFHDKGYQIFSNVLSIQETRHYKLRLVDVYKDQVSEFGAENLKKTGEENIVRSPFLYDDEFKHIFYNTFTQRVVSDILGEHAILSLQNGIRVVGNQEHHQSFYHRDIIHQNFTSSRPLAINLYYCLDDYTEENGATTFIPSSHKHESVLFEKGETPNIKAGSVILFNSMTYHKAGTNKTNFDRCGINNMYTLPFLKQQINYPYFLKDKTEDPKLNRLLGFESREYLSVKHFRNYRLSRCST